MRAVILRKGEEGFSRSIEEINPPSVCLSDLVCALEYSSLNYKDALAITNRGPVVRRWPMVPGIDGAGVVEQSSSATFSEGTPVFVTGWGLGETQHGCLADSVSLPQEFPATLPIGLSLRDVMAVGTAGLTAMLCLLRIEAHGVRPQDGPVLVTGASGGVGSMALMFLKELGYTAVASTGRLEEADYLQHIGASRVVDRAELSEPGRPLRKEEWAAVVDSVGSHTLANACASTKYRGIVAACGLAQGMDFPATVAPFILRGVTLAGIDSVMAPHPLRRAAWDRIAHVLDREALGKITHEIALSDVFQAAEELLAGKIRGRLVVNVRK